MTRFARSSLAVHRVRFGAGVALTVAIAACGGEDDGLGQARDGQGPAAASASDRGDRHAPARLDDVRNDGVTPHAWNDSPADPAGEPDGPAPPAGQGGVEGDPSPELGPDPVPEPEAGPEAQPDGEPDAQPEGDPDAPVVEDPSPAADDPATEDDPEEGDAPVAGEDDVTHVVVLIPGTAVSGEWFDLMFERLSADGYEPVVWEAPDRLTDGLAQGGERIGEAVRSIAEERGVERVHLVAECNGGVAARWWLQHLGGAEEGLVDQFVTFVAAHHGTWLSPGGWVTGWQSFRDIKPVSRFLADLNSTPLPESVRMTSIYTCRDEFFLPDDTARLDGAVNVEFCDRRLRHFDTFTDAVVYDRILAALEGQGAEAGVRF